MRVLYKRLFLFYVCKMIFTINPKHWLKFYLLRSVFFYLNYCSMFVCGCFFYKTWFLCMILKWSLSYIKFIDGFLTFLDQYVVSLDVIFCIFLNNHYLISSPEIDTLLTLICLFIYFFLIYCRYDFSILQESITMYDSKIILVFYPFLRKILHLFRSLCCFFPFDFV